MSEKENADGEAKFEYGANDRPALSTAILMGFQHIMVSLSGMLVIAYLVSDFVCVTGEAKVELRARLISATVIMSGIITLLQNTFGLRPAFAFIPPLYAFSKLPEMRCDAGNDVDYIQQLQIISGSVAGAGIAQLLLGATGLIGFISKRVGPLTITPLMILLCIGNCAIVLEKSALHWISLVQFSILFIFIYFMGDVQVPIPMIQDKKVRIGHYRLFGMFPYLLGILITWLLAFVLTKHDIIPEGNPGRVDNPNSINIIKSIPYFSLPYPGQFGAPQFSLGLLLGCVTSAIAASVESLGAYKTLARVTLESPPSATSINRATMVQGLGCATFGLFGCGVGITAYSENIAIVSIVRNASRLVLQMSGILLILVGLLTKLAAILAAIPDPMASIGGVFGVSVCLVCGICLSNLEPVNLGNAKTLTTLGTAIILGVIIPNFVETYPIETGMKILDQSLNILLTTRMFVGGLIGFVLDNLSGHPLVEESSNDDANEEVGHSQTSGYSFPPAVNRWLLAKNKILRFLPFLPTKAELTANIRQQEQTGDQNEEKRHEMHALIGQKQV